MVAFRQPANDLTAASTRASMPVVPRGERTIGEPNGVMTVRGPVDLHKRLVELAEQQGVSLNTLNVSLLAGAIEFDLRGWGR